MTSGRVGTEEAADGERVAAPRRHGAAHDAPADPGRVWRRRRRIARQRRALDQITAWLLGLLVLVSLALGVALWSGMLWPPLATVGPSPHYVAADATLAGDANRALMPEWMIELYPGGNDIAPDASSMPVVWDAVRATLTALTTGQFATASPVDYTTIAAQAAAIPACGDPTSPCIGVELYLGAQVQWPSWVRALGGTGFPGTKPTFDRVAILPSPKAPPACTSTAGLPSGAAAVDFFTGVEGQGLQVELNLQDYCDLVAALRSQQAVGDPVAAVPARAHGLPVAPGVLAPTAFKWEPVALQPEGLDPRQLARSIFFDFATVHETTLNAGGLQFSNPENWVLSATPSEAALVLPTPRAASGVVPWNVGLSDAVRYVSAWGGWPLTSWLAGSQLLRCASASCVNEYQFSTSFDGLPILPPTGTPAPITLQLAGSGGQPVLYVRDVPVPGAQIAGGPQHPIHAAAAVAAVAQTPPAILAPAIQAGTAQVIAVFPAWVPIQGLSRMEPAWAVSVQYGSQGTETVLVDAYQGSVLGTWPPT